ncbi:hypothetical protein ABZX77_02200 [Streptomyces sp. NPDC004237]|uniref:hypothetical protein n=1 Tax=Streptomyces sp. NPDC004237 TaxID=3154455 RepID=UPI0033B9A48C
MEIALTRPATRRELHHACRAVPLAANADRTRLMTVRQAKSPGRALRSLRHDLDRLLPIDVLTTHYPDASSQVLLNVALTRDTRSVIRRAATAHGQKPAEFVARTVVAAVERDKQVRARQLAVQLRRILVHHAPEDVLICTARILLDRRHPAPPTPRDADSSLPSSGSHPPR